VVQAWNAQTARSLPAFPQAVEDFQLLSEPDGRGPSDSPGNEVVVGTALLPAQLNGGLEGSGTKFTGGWIRHAGAGDADGDGDSR
jgi:hypothetical protein